MKPPLSLLVLLAPAAAAAAPPAAVRHPVEDSYHGQKIVDDYRWLEDSSSRPVKAWAGAQSKLARAKLEGLPATRALAERYQEIDDKRPAVTWPFRIGRSSS